MTIVALAMAIFAVAAEARTTTSAAPTLGQAGAIGDPAPDLGGVSLALGIGAVIAIVLIASRRRPSRLQPEATDRDRQAAIETMSVLAASRSPAANTADEAHIPRWRRPSLAAARVRTDATAAERAGLAEPMAAARRPVLVFETSVDAPAERLYVRYDSVLMFDRPDEILGRRLLELDATDEVDVLERDEAWARVMTPLGLAGWVPGMALTTMRPTFADVAPAPPPEDETGDPPPAHEPPLLDSLVKAVVDARRARNEPTKLGDLLDGAAKPRPPRRQAQRKAVAPAASPAEHRSPVRRRSAARGA
jgi:hypothetical protein